MLDLLIKMATIMIQQRPSMDHMEKPLFSQDLRLLVTMHGCNNGACSEITVIQSIVIQTFC